MNQKYMIYMYLLKARTFIALLLVVAFFSVMVPNFLTTSNLLIMTQHVAITGLLAIGMTLVILTGESTFQSAPWPGFAAWWPAPC
jgi:erythritol transport system permease protein